MNKPVAWMYKMRDSANKWELIFNKPINDEFFETVPLYTHPVKELNDGGEPVKNATYWKRQYNLMATQNDNLKSGLYHANEQIKYLETHPVKELTDEEIYRLLADSIWAVGLNTDCLDEQNWADGITVARAILRKAQEK